MVIGTPTSWNSIGFCGNHRYRLLRQIGVDELREFRNDCAPRWGVNTLRNRFQFLRGFFGFCQVAGWIARNPVAGVQLPREKLTPTLPFEDDEIARMLSATDTFTAKGIFGRGENRKRIRAMILLLRYSGLRISDAATLERSRITGTKLFM